jgi:tetratricopeptide (TPR) repeat protein
MTLTNQGILEARLGEFEQANHLLQEALTRHRRFGDVWGTAVALQNQSWAYILQNRFEEAADLVAQSKNICQKIQSDGLFVNFYRYSALIAFHRREYFTANQLLKKALLLRQQIGVSRYMLDILETTIQIAVGQADHNKGLILAGAVTAYRQKHNLVTPPVEKKLVDDAIALARQQLTPEAATAAWAEGAAMTLDEALTYALAEE